MQINDGTDSKYPNLHYQTVQYLSSFSKKSHYSNKRVLRWRNTLTNDLPENVDHTLKVWADDGQGGISTIEEENSGDSQQTTCNFWNDD